MVIEASDRGSDQAEHIATLLGGLSIKDRAMVVYVMERICEGVRGGSGVSFLPPRHAANIGIYSHWSGEQGSGRCRKLI